MKEMNLISNSPATLADLLTDCVAQCPSKVAFYFADRNAEETARITYGQLARYANAIGNAIQAMGIGPESRAILLYPSGPEFIHAFWACIYTGVISIPVCPPHPARLERTLPRVKSILGDAKPEVVLTTSSILTSVKMLFRDTPWVLDMKWLATDEIDATGAGFDPVSRSRPDDLVMIQYTSGSTGFPKGVMLRHDNMLAHQKILKTAMKSHEDSVVVGWVPLCVDAGTSGLIIHPVYGKIPAVVIPTTVFYQEPVSWLRAMTSYRGTISGGPNFAYDLCVRKVKRNQLASLDLSSWETALNGSEPVNYDTIKRFTRYFGMCGFRMQSFVPCYGLAEATMLVSAGDNCQPPLVKRIDRSGLGHGRVVANESAGSGIDVVGCGAPLPGVDLAIVDPTSGCPREDAACEVGEIWVSGPSLGQGYWHQPQQTRNRFHSTLTDSESNSRWLRTGDMGFFTQGQLFIVGSLADQMFIGGVNYYPHHIERTVECCHPRIRPGGCAAFTVSAEGEHRLAIVAEVERRYGRSKAKSSDAMVSGQMPRLFTVFPEIVPEDSSPFDPEMIMDEIRRSVYEDHNLHAYAVVLVRVGSLLKTFNGKVQRHACRTAFQERSLDVVSESILSGMDRVDFSGIPGKERLLTASAETRRELLESAFRYLIAKVTGFSPSRISPDRPLSHYGIDSLMALELRHLLEVRLGFVWPITRFLKGPTIFQLINEALEQFDSGIGLRQMIASGRFFSGELPLSYNQLAIWLLSRICPETPGLIVHLLCRIPPPADVAALQRAIQKLVIRHPMLRTRFTMKDGRPIQWIHDSAEVPVQVIHGQNWEQTQTDAQIHQLMTQPMDIERDSVIKARVLVDKDAGAVFLLAVHRIAVDYASIFILLKELNYIYTEETSAGGKTVGLSDLVLAPHLYSYGDFVQWQADQVFGTEGDRQWIYWRNQLAGCPSYLQLPIDYARNRFTDYDGQYHTIFIDERVGHMLRELSKHYHATMFMTIIAAFQVLLFRYTGQTDIVVGTLVSGRSRPEFRNLVGHFENLVPIRSDLSDLPNFTNFLARVRQTVIDGLAYQDYPFQLLIDKLNPGRCPDKRSLFQVLCFMEPTLQSVSGASSLFFEKGGKLTKHPVKMEPERVFIGQSTYGYDLGMVVSDTNGMLAIRLEYNATLFNPSTIARMGDHFAYLLSEIASTPVRPISELGLMDPAECQEITTKFSRLNPPICLDTDNPLVWIDHHTDPSSDQLAVVWENVQWTYGQLNQQANAIAVLLRNTYGVGPDDHVATLLTPSPWVLACFLGILKAGAVYVPLDPESPPQRIQSCLDECGARIVLTEAPFKEMLGAFGGIRAIVDIVHGIDVDSLSNLDVSWRPDRPVCRFFVSTPSGVPMGITHDLAEFANEINWMRKEIGNRRRLLLGAPIDTSESVREILFGLSCGATCFMAKPEITYDMMDFMGFVTDHDIDIIHMASSQWRMLIAEDGCQRFKASCLTHVLTYGDPVWMNTEVQTFMLANPQLCWFHLYAIPTSLLITAHKVDPESMSSRAPANRLLGHPVANMEIRILDPWGKPVPVGAVGTIHVQGSGIAREIPRFYPSGEKKHSEFLSDNGRQEVSTGDLGRWRADGAIEFCGRKDSRVDLQGHWVCLDEISYWLRRFPGVQQAQVVRRYVRETCMELVAYLVSSRDLDGSTLKSHLKTYLPSYMIPAYYIQVDRIVRCEDGSVDTRLLPDSREASFEGELAGIVPMDELELRLAKMWGKILETEIIGLRDNFFELGGTSLAVIRMLDQVESHLKVTISPMDFFRNPILEHLAELIRDYIHSNQTQS